MRLLLAGESVFDDQLQELDAERFGGIVEYASFANDFLKFFGPIGSNYYDWKLGQRAFYGIDNSARFDVG